MSLTTLIHCPVTICMLINDAVCCGVNAWGPDSAPRYVGVHWYPDTAPDSVVLVPITMQAMFNRDPTVKRSRPSCSETYQWPATSKSSDSSLHFTENLELAYDISNEIIPQLFFARDDSGPLKSTGENSCPFRNQLVETTNPYYDPFYPNAVDPSQQSNLGTENSINQPISYIPSSGPAVSVANANLYLDNEAYTNSAKPLGPSISNPSHPSTPPLWPVEVASTLDTALNTAGSGADGCTGYGCGMGSSMQFNPNTSKRVKPVEFRA